MKYEEKYLTYKGKIVFGKQSMPYFNRMPKEYSENEACFVFVNQGEVSVRAQEEYIDLDQNSVNGKSHTEVGSMIKGLPGIIVTIDNYHY